MHDRGITAVKRAAVQSLLGCFRIVVVASHDDIAARHDFTLRHPIMRHLVALRIHHA